MGSCPCNGSSDAKTREIDNIMRRDANVDAEVIKLLFLGAGGSGKSTLFKQLRIMHGNGLEKDERKLYRKNVHANIAEGLKILAKVVQPEPEENEEEEKEVVTARELDDELAGMIAKIKQLDSNNDVNEDTKALLTNFWNHETIFKTWENRSEIQVQDSLAYFMRRENLNRIVGPNYIPSRPDCLYVRARTTGIVEEYFMISNRQFLIVDVGGQRSERKKWIKCFEGVTGIIFVVSLSGYNEYLFEDENTIRLQESLKVFEDLNRNSLGILKDASLIIFLNKWDLFQTKIQDPEKPLTLCFEDYKGPGDDPEKAFQYIKQKFLEKNPDNQRKVYVHKTCATNTDQMRIIFDVVNHTIINKALVKAGLLVA